MSIIDEVKKKFDSLKPEAKKRVVYALIILGGITVATGGHFLSGDKKVVVKTKEIGAQPLASNTKILENSVTAQQAQLKARIEELEKRENAAKALTAEQQQAKTAQPAKASPAPAKPMNTKSTPPPALPPLPPASALPPPPMSNPNIRSGINHKNNERGKSEVIMEMGGDIEYIASEKSSSKEGGTGGNAKKKVEEVLHMPSGTFSEATLLHGLYAPTTSAAKGEPTPVLIRIKTLSQLPNKVKSDLKGCFVIASAVGKLSDRRAHLRLTNISCITKGGEAIIDQKIKGYVVDADGFIGLKGRIVSKMGDAIVRSFFAGLLGGIGTGLKSSAQNTSYSALGVTSMPIVDPGKIAISGAGQGLADATRQIQRFYLDLARETVPVVEVKPQKKITMILTEGVKLNVKPIKKNI